MNGRYRIVTDELGGERHVSPLVFSEEEALETLDADELLHRASGWRVTRGPRMLLASTEETMRLITARLVDPMSDDTDALREGGAWTT